MKVLIATDKPFAPAAVASIREVVETAGHELALLEKYTEKQQLLDAVSDANAVIIRSDKITDEVIAAAPELKIVVRAGAGYDNVDLTAATANNVVVENTPGQNANAVAELVFGMLVMSARGFYSGKPGTELRGKTIGIHAFGNIGRDVATIAKGFGMQVAAFDPFVTADKIEAAGVKAVATIEELYSTCDYVSLHIPATKETKNSINSELIATMKPGATLINTARKEVISEACLLNAVEAGKVKYISDIAPDNAAAYAAKCEGNYFFTPKKMGAQTAEANLNAGLAAANQIVAFFKDGDTTFKVN